MLVAISDRKFGDLPSSNPEFTKLECVYQASIRHCHPLANVVKLNPVLMNACCRAYTVERRKAEIPWDRHRHRHGL